MPIVSFPPSALISSHRRGPRGRTRAACRRRPRAASDRCMKPRRDKLPRFMEKIPDRVVPITGGHFSRAESSPDANSRGIPSNAASLRVPDQLVQLELQPHVEPAIEQPVARSSGLHRAEYRRQKTENRRRGGARESSSAAQSKSPPAGDDELDLVGRLEPSRGSARSCAPHSPLSGHLRSMMMCTRRSTGPTSWAPLVSSRTVRPASASRVISGNTSGLQQRLAAGDLDQRRRELPALASTTSSSAARRSPWVKACGVSHQTQRGSHTAVGRRRTAARRTSIRPGCCGKSRGGEAVQPEAIPARQPAERLSRSTSLSYRKRPNPRPPSRSGKNPHPHPLSRKAGRGEQNGLPSPGFAGEGTGVRGFFTRTRQHRWASQLPLLHPPSWLFPALGGSP